MSLKDERKRDFSSSVMIYSSTISPTQVAFAPEPSLSFAELQGRSLLNSILLRSENKYTVSEFSGWKGS